MTSKNSEKTTEIKEQNFVILPRFGTISPWASKALSILHNVGLTKVTGIERGIWYHYEGESLTQEVLQTFFYDRMTQSCVLDCDSVEDVEALEQEVFREIRS